MARQGSKVVKVVGELQTYQVTVAALQETNWFGNESYNVKENIVLTPGRPTPEAEQPQCRG